MTCWFVPPYLLAHLAALEPDGPLGRRGRATLQLDERLRGRRQSPAAPPVVRSARAGTTAPRRVIHSADNSEQLPGRVVRGDDDPATGDAAVDEAHASSAAVWDLFAEEFDRPSVDGTGATLSVTVHYGQDYDNAFWDGTQLVFGDGDGQVFDRFTKPMDVLAHEFTHGVTQFSAGLTYRGQSGALNESVSDVFASMTRQRALGQDAAAADWLIGQGLFRPGIAAVALRSMLQPGTAYDDPRLGRDPQVGSMADYVDTAEDNGGVHINSGIPNRAFALAAVGVGGRSWDRTGKVWYDALTGGRVTADTDFAGFATATVTSAEQLFPDDPTVAGQVRVAWEQVGVLAAGGRPTPPPAGLAPGGTSGPPPLDTLPAGTLSVRRTGGFAGVVRAGELDLDADPQGPRVRALLLQADLTQVALRPPAPDRFVYTVAVGAWELTVPELDLTPELDQVVRIVLDPETFDLG